MSIDLELTRKEVEVLNNGGFIVMLLNGLKVVVSLNNLTESEDEK